MLGSAEEADDAVQEAWLRLTRTGGEEIDNLGAWLTTVVSRVCLNALQTRRARPEVPLDEDLDLVDEDAGPLNETMLADTLGLALLVVLDTLSPAERVAFVLHDLFGVSFEEIGPTVGRNATAARQLASRARRRVRDEDPEADRLRQAELVDAFLAAARDGEFARYARGATPALLDGGAAVVWLVGGAPRVVYRFHRRRTDHRHRPDRRPGPDPRARPRHRRVSRFTPGVDGSGPGAARIYGLQGG
jgi:RNA polymerase sigma factor (sigma-70 family)